MCVKLYPSSKQDFPFHPQAQMGSVSWPGRLVPKEGLVRVRAGGRERQVKGQYQQVDKKTKQNRSVSFVLDSATELVSPASLCQEFSQFVFELAWHL